MKKFFLLVCFFLLSFGTARAEVQIIHSGILPNGDFPAVTISCAVGNIYTLSLVHREGNSAGHNFGQLSRKFCADGSIVFDSFNLNNLLTTRIDLSWWGWVNTPLEYIVKDTTSQSHCDQNGCDSFNLEGEFNGYDKSVYLASSTYYPTVAVGPIFDTKDHTTWFNTGDISLDVSIGTRTATVHSYVADADVDGSVSLKILDSGGGQVFVSSVVATTTGDFSYSWNFPALTDPATTRPGEFVFRAEVDGSSGAKRVAEKTVTLASPRDGYPGYTNSARDVSQAPIESYSHLVQTLGTGFFGTLSQVDIMSNNPVADYYGSSPALAFYECDDENYGLPTLTGGGCAVLFSGLFDTMSHKDAGVQSFYLDSPVTLNPSKYYFFIVKGNNQLNAIPYFFGSARDTVDGSCYQYQSRNETFHPCPDVADLYFYLRGVSGPPSHLADNILFLPGIEASRLYRTGADGVEHLLWEPWGDQNVRDIELGEDGEPLSGDSIYTRDVIDEAYKDKMGTLAPNIYKTFLERLAQMKNDGTIADYSAVPYDWRLSLDDILNGGFVTNIGAGDRISYTAMSGDPYIIAQLRKLAASSESGKVTIIAHSNGGLLTKALMARLATTDPTLAAKIDKIIFVAVPQIGTPEAVVALMHGIEQALPTDWFPKLLSQHTAREFAHNSTIAYNLLPSLDYFNSVYTPLITFDDSLPDWRDKYGAPSGPYKGEIQTPDLLSKFLTDNFGRVDYKSEDISTPVSVSSAFLDKAKVLHTMLDSWTAPSNTQVFEIAGWGVPSTISGVNYTSGKAFCITYFANVCNTAPAIQPNPTWTIDGDGVVVTPSALWMSDAKRYWVDLKQYNSAHKAETLLGIFPFKHKDILEVQELDTFIQQIITNQKLTTLPQYISDTAPTAGANDTRLVFSLRSGLALNIYDSLGNHTGISTTTGAMEENIPGTFVTQVAGATYIFDDGTSDTKKVIITPTRGVSSGADSQSDTGGDTSGVYPSGGSASGAATPIIFQIQQFSNNDTLLASTTFAVLTNTASTTAEISMTGNGIPTNPLLIDTNGDGQTDATLTPTTNGTATFVAEARGVASGSEADGGDSSGGSISSGDSLGVGGEATHSPSAATFANGPIAVTVVPVPQTRPSDSVPVVASGAGSRAGGLSSGADFGSDTGGETSGAPIAISTSTPSTSTPISITLNSSSNNHLLANVSSSNIASLFSIDSPQKLALWSFIIFLLFVILFIIH